MCNYFLFSGTYKLNMLLQTLYFPQHSLLTCFISSHGVMFCYLSICTFTSKFKHLVCQVSFSIYISRNLCSSFFKHLVIDSISYLCLTDVLDITSSCRIAAFFISSTIKVNVPSTIMKFYYKAFKVSLASLSSFWVFLNFYWISWSSWSNYLWASTRPTLFFSHSYLWVSNSRGSIWCSMPFRSYNIMPCKCSNSKESC